MKSDANPVSTWLTDVGLNTEATKDIQTLFQSNIFDYSKPLSLINHLVQTSTSEDDIVLDFFAGSGTTGEAVMRLNAQDGGHRQFILVQIPQPIDPKKQKEAHRFVTEDLGKPATIFEITAERLRRAGQRLEAAQATQAQNQGTLLEAAPPVDTGFRVFDLVEDTQALILRQPLVDVTQDDLSFFIEGGVVSDLPAENLALTAEQAVAQTAAPADAVAGAASITVKESRVLYNLLLAEGLPLTTRLIEVLPRAVYLADDVALILQAVPLDTLTDTLHQLKAEGRAARALTVYAPGIQDDDFMQGIKTLSESLGYSSEKLRLRG